MLSLTHTRPIIGAALLFVTVSDSQGQGNPFVQDVGSVFSELAYPSTCALWGDYNGDGDLDLLIANGLGPSFLYVNRGEGVFGRRSFPLAPVTTTGGAWADFDNDGDLDLVLCAISPGGQVLMNSGHGNFEHGQAFETDGRACSALDYDLDGAMDIVLTRRFGLADRLYHNNGAGNFTFVNSVISQTSGDGTSVSWADYDLDGDPDLYITNNVGERNFFFENTGGDFAIRNHGPHVEEFASSVSPSWGDYDGDLDFDLFVSNHDGYPNALYKNENHEFVAEESGVVVENKDESYGSAWGDIDNDGDLDLIVLNRDGRFNLYSNDGEGGFVDYSFGNPINVRAAATVLSDTDGDGDLDLIATAGSHNTYESDLYYENRSDQQNNWLQVELRGLVPISNSMGVGARVYISARISGVDIWQVREMRTLSGYHAQEGYRLHFGLGDAAIVDSLIVAWPSGTQQSIVDVGINQLLRVSELPTTSNDPVLPIESSDPLHVYPNPSRSRFTIEVRTPAPGSFSVDIINARGQLVGVLSGNTTSSQVVALNWDGFALASPLPSGTYFLQLRSGGQVWTDTVSIIR